MNNKNLNNFRNIYTKVNQLFI